MAFEALLARLRRGNRAAGIETDLLDPDVLRVGDLPTPVVAGQSWNYNDVTYRGESRTAFELHMEASGAAWQRSPNDRRYYHFANSLTYDGTKLILRLTLPAAPGNASNGRVDGTPLAWTPATSTWTATAGQYEYQATVSPNPLPAIGEFTLGFTLQNAQTVWYPQGRTAVGESFTGKDAHLLSAFDTEGYTDIANAIDQQGFLTSPPTDLPNSDLDSRSYGTTYTWTGTTTNTWYKPFRVPIARKGEIRSFHARVGSQTLPTLTVLGDLSGFTYGYITLHGYAANSVVSLQQLGKVSIQATRVDADNWNQALGFYVSGTAALLPSGAPAGSRAIVSSNGIWGNGVWYKYNDPAGWTWIAGFPPVYPSKAALDAARPMPPTGTIAIVSGDSGLGVYIRLASSWKEIANIGASGGAGSTPQDVLTALAGATLTGVIDLRYLPRMDYGHLPTSLAYLGKAFRRGGERDWPGDDVQIGQFIQAAAFTGIPQNYGWKQGNAPDGLLQVAVRDDSLGGTLANNAHVLIRFSKTAYPDRPDIDDVPELQLRLGYEGESPVIRPALTAVAVVDDNYWYQDALIPLLPADSNAYLERNEPPIIDAGLEDGALTPAMMKLEGAPVEGGYYSYHDGQFQMRRAAGWQQLYRGTQGITVTNLQGNSGLQRITYDSPFNLNHAHDGYYLFEVTMTWAAGHDPATLAFDTDGSDTVSASGQVALFQVKAEAAYDGVNNLGAVGLRLPVYGGSGSDTHIGDVVWRADHANDFDGASNVRFEGISGTGVTGTGGSISARAEIWFISSGAASAGEHIPNSISTLFGFDDALPLATSYQVGTAAMVNEGVQRGVWRNEDETIEGTGLGLAGKTFDYQYDAQQVVHGDRTWHILARNAFTLTDFPGVNFAAYGNLAPWPAEMEFIAYGYVTSGRSDGRIYIGFNADQTATNNVQFETGGTGVAIVRQTDRLWEAQGISAANNGHIRQGVWEFEEPGATGTRHTQKWTDLGAPRWVELLDWAPANGPQLSYLSLYEVPTAQALDPALSEEHDNWAMDIEIQVATTASAAGRIWSMEETIHCRDWRLAANSPAGANLGNIAEGWQGGVFISDNEASGASWTRFVFCKGPNGRVAIVQAWNNALYLRRIRAVRHT